MGICRWTDEETDDNVLGSGADQWEWYDSAIEWDDVKCVYRVIMQHENDDDLSIPMSFTRGKVRSTASEIMVGEHNLNDRIVGYFRNDDPDADAMDCLIQVIVYGKVVFG